MIKFTVRRCLKAQIMLNSFQLNGFNERHPVEGEVELGFHRNLKNVLKDLKACIQGFPESNEKKSMLERVSNVENMICLIADGVPNTSLQMVPFLREMEALLEGLFPGSESTFLCRELTNLAMRMWYDGEIGQFQRLDYAIPLLVPPNSGPSDRTTMMGPGMFLVCLHAQDNPSTTKK